jgi:hypothetical protein
LKEEWSGGTMKAEESGEARKNLRISSILLFFVFISFYYENTTYLKDLNVSSWSYHIVFQNTAMKICNGAVKMSANEEPQAVC